MLCAMAFVVTAVVHIPLMPSAPFLTYDPKDIIIVIGGFIFGPLASVLISVIVSLAELVTISNTGIIGMIMNIISSTAFAVAASAVYRKKHSLGGAALGLVCGVCSMTALMLLWNYFITPVYMGTPRAVVKAMLIPVFLPFNLIKGGLNAALTMMIYKPAVTALRKAGLIPKSSETGGKPSVWVILLSALVLAALICVVMIIT